MPIRVICQNPACAKPFDTYNCFLKKGGGKYCSNACQLEHQKPPHIVVCAYPSCQKPFRATPAKVKKGWQKHCSAECYRLDTNARLLPRFWEKVVKTETCWLWTGAQGEKGYGTIRIDGHGVPVHRFSYEIHFGAIPYSLFVCHNCPGGDNPSCVNPEHLWLGTPKENLHDAIKKGTFFFAGREGELHVQAKLTDKEVLYIRSQKGIMTAKELALSCNAKESNIYMIWCGKTWRHLL